VVLFLLLGDPWKLDPTPEWLESIRERALAKAYPDGLLLRKEFKDNTIVLDPESVEFLTSGGWEFSTVI
jgi:hypothetical protein